MHHDVLNHLDGFRHIESLVGTGAFKGEKIPRLTTAEEDPFFSCMASFVTTSRADCAAIWSCNAQVLRAYKELSLYFDDPTYVYPPPKDDQDGKRDLFGLLHSFASDCVKVRQDIDALASPLAAEVRLQCRFTLPYLDSGSEFSDGSQSPCEHTEPASKPSVQSFTHDVHALRARMPSPQRPPQTLSEASLPPREASQHLILFHACLQMFATC